MASIFICTNLPFDTQVFKLLYLALAQHRERVNGNQVQ